MRKLFAINSIILLWVSVFVQTIYAQQPTGERIKWMSFEEAINHSQKEPRKIFIDVYTQWCGWCKHMDATTFQDPEIISYMNSKYYAVKLDAETKDTIHFKDRAFVYKPDMKANEIALSLLNGKMGYPTSIYMDEAFGILTPVSGFVAAPELKPILHYFGDDAYKTMNFDDFKKNFSPVVPTVVTPPPSPN